jgi:adenylate kinase
MQNYLARGGAKPQSSGLACDKFKKGANANLCMQRKRGHPPAVLAAKRKAGPHPSILLTGVPCTGKTSLARAWCAKSGWAFLPLGELVERKKLYSGVDMEDGTKIAKLKALEREANKIIKSSHSSILVEGHLGCEIKLNVSRVLVLRLQPDELASRLSARHYPKFKIEENRLAEMLDYCTVRSIQNYGEKKVYELDGSGSALGKNLARFASFASARAVPASFRPHADWSAQLFREAG